MRRRIGEFIMFFLTGFFLVAAFNFQRPDKYAPKLLVDTHSSIPVFATDTTLLFDTVHHPVGTLYPSGGVVYLTRPFIIDSNRIRIRIYAWIYYKHIFNLGDEWLLVQDENIRVKNNCLKIGRIAKNTRLPRIWSPNDWIWNFVSFDGFVEIRHLRSYVDGRYQPFFSERWPYPIKTDLTTDGHKFPSRRKLPKIRFLDFLTLFPFIGMVIILWFYFRKTNRLHCRDRWVLLVIDIVGFAAGVGLGLGIVV